MKTGLVLEGGSIRGIFTAGVLDYLLEKNYDFSYVVGVSAGSGNGINYMSKQKGRSKKVIMHEGQESYYGLAQLVKNKVVLNLDELVIGYATDVFPYDYETYLNSKTEYECVAVNCETGKAEYFGGFTSKDMLYHATMASCAVPFICDPVEMNGQKYLDGSVADSVPIERALEKGCDKMVVILTRVEGDHPTDYSKMPAVINLSYEKKYPELCKTLINRTQMYREQMELLAQLEQEKKAFVIRPVIHNIGHFEMHENKIIDCYNEGYEQMEDRWQEFLDFMKE